jgi:hypothetical protein
MLIVNIDVDLKEYLGKVHWNKVRPREGFLGKIAFRDYLFLVHFFLTVPPALK